MSFVKDKSSDNYKTPKKAWENILEYIPKNKVIWEPFYCDGSSGKDLKDLGFKVIHKNEDFFRHNRGDIIVSNPPFSKKKEILKRLKELDKPFILILPSMMLSYKYFQELFSDDIQVIIPKKRINFKHIDWKEDKNYSPPFASFYFCYKINLHNDLIFI